MPEHVRHNLTLRRDTVAKFYGMITRPVNRNIEDQDLTLNIAGIRKRLYEHPMTESYVAGGDVGAMVTSVFEAMLLTFLWVLALAVVCLPLALC
jgi:hypothetical protein